MDRFLVVWQFFLSFFWQGALTHGDRRATESQDLSRYNFDNKVAVNISDNACGQVHGVAVQVQFLMMSDF